MVSLIYAFILRVVMCKHNTGHGMIGFNFSNSPI